MTEDTGLPGGITERQLQIAYRKQERTKIWDPCYGPIILPWDLAQSPEIRRLSHFSQGSIPYWWSCTGTPCTTAEHARGSAYLGECLLKSNPELRDLCPHLPISLLVHDLGGGPFRHVSDHFMKMMLGYGHENRLGDVLHGTRLERAIVRRGYTVEDIIADCAGHSFPGGALVNGNLDLDTLDNVIRYCLSKGLFSKGWEQSLHLRNLLPPWGYDVLYDPVKITEAYRLLNGVLCFDQSALPDIQKYLNARQHMYAHIASDMNRTVEAMLYQAIDLAYQAGEIPESFFSMTDTEAYQHLLRCNGRTRRLIERADRGKPYYLSTLVQATPLQSGCDDLGSRVRSGYLKDPGSWRRTAEMVSGITGLPPEDVCVYIQNGDKSCRTVTTPILSTDGELQPFEHSCRCVRPWVVAVYLVRYPKKGEEDRIEQGITSLMYGQS